MGRPKGSKNKTSNPNENRGGARAGAGRKPKADEMKLIERLDSIISMDDALDELKKLALGYSFTKYNDKGEPIEIEIPGDLKALTLYFNYRWGKPSQSTDITSGGEKISIPIINMNEWK